VAWLGTVLKGRRIVQGTIIKVFSKPKEFVSKTNGNTLATVRVLFDDETEGQVLTTPDKAQDHIDRLLPLVGQAHDYEVEEKTFQGEKQYSIKNYPGKPQAGSGGFGGGRGNFTPAYANTREGLLYEQERMDRRTALMQAVQLKGEQWNEDMLKTADRFYQWLRATSNAPAVTSTAPETAANGAGVPATVRQSNGAAEGKLEPGAIYEGEGQCEHCHAPQGKRHGQPCVG
jgi:hypothetical protein